MVRERPGCEQLALGEAVHLEAYEASGAGPGVLFQFRADAAREDEPPRPRVVVDGSFDRAEHGRDLLPLIEEDRFGATRQRRVGIGAECFCLNRLIEADLTCRVLTRGRGLACGTRPVDQHRRYGAEQLAEPGVEEPRAITGGPCRLSHVKHRISE